MKTLFSIFLLFSILCTFTGCHQCSRCGWIQRNPVTPKDCYYQDYYESPPLVSSQDFH